MKTATINGVTLEYDDTGDGEPMLLIHGAMIAATFETMAREPALAHYRKVRPHRRGYAGSEHPEGMSSIATQAKDALALLRHLGIERAHVVGHSYGGQMALRMAIESPSFVHTLSLLEPPLLASPFAREFMETARQHLLEPYGRGEVARAAETFLDAVAGPGSRARVELAMPGAWETALVDSTTLFEREFPVMIEGGLFVEAEGSQVNVPALSVVGANSDSLFQSSHQALMKSLPKVEGAVIPDATHFLQVEQPRRVAEAIAAFAARHPIRD